MICKSLGFTTIVEISSRFVNIAFYNKVYLHTASKRVCVCAYIYKCLFGYLPSDRRLKLKQKWMVG